MVCHCILGCLLTALASGTPVRAAPPRASDNEMRIFETRQNVNMVLERIRRARDGFLRVLWMSELPENAEGERYGAWLESLYGNLQYEQDDLEALDRELLRLAGFADNAAMLEQYAGTGIWDRVRRAEETLDFLAEQGRHGAASGTPFDFSDSGSGSLSNTVDETFQDLSAFLSYQHEQVEQTAPQSGERGRGQAKKNPDVRENLPPFREGTLHAPVYGSLVQNFQPEAVPPVRGLGFAADDVTVYAAASGRVIYSGVLPGAGWVLVLRHHAPVYTLYAYLEQSSRVKGDIVVQGDVLGRAGYYPPAQGLGLYFELRFGQKAISPEPWLAHESRVSKEK